MWGIIGVCLKKFVLIHVDSKIYEQNIPKWRLYFGLFFSVCLKNTLWFYLALKFDY